MKTTELVNETSFRALLRLSPAVPEAGFWLSGLREPTSHPKLAECLAMIPDQAAPAAPR